MRPERFEEPPVPIGECHLWSNNGTTEYDCRYCGEHRKWMDSGTQRCPARGAGVLSDVLHRAESQLAEIKGWLRLCKDDPDGHTEFYKWACLVFFNEYRGQTADEVFPDGAA